MKDKRHILISIFIALLSGLLFSAQLAAQNVTITTLEGVVVDEQGTPLAGVVVRSENGKNEMVTDFNGTYRLMVADRSMFASFSLLGYRNSVVYFNEQDNHDVILKKDAHLQDQMIDLGYTTQSRNSLTGAISTVSGATLDKHPVAILSQTFAGHLPGLTAIEYNSELGRANVWLMVRGISTINGRNPVVVIDGVVCPNTNYDYISPQEIESITILKDAATTAIYGIQGANGVIVITTKRGFSGETKINVSLDYSIQQRTKEYKPINAVQYANLRNEAGANDGLGSFSQISQSDIDMYASGADRDLYPDTDYYNMFLKDITSMKRVNVDIAGGNDQIKYYSNVNFMSQDLPFKIAESGGKYDPTPSNNWINFRSNLDFRINRHIEGFVRLSGNVKREKTTGFENSAIYSRLFNLPPTMYGPLTPEILDLSGNVVVPGGEVITHDRETAPVYGMLNRSGYNIHLVTNIIAQAGLTIDLSSLTKGLKLSGLMSYQTNSVNSTRNNRNFERWVRTSDKDELMFVKKGGDINSDLRYNKGRLFFYNINLFAKADYNRRFGDHSIDAMAYTFYLQQDKESWSDVAGIMPYYRQSLGVTATYGFRDTYYVKGDLGYSGSDQFHKDHRFVATPAISAAWVISNEEFMPELDWLSYLKVRASYGLTANDQLGYNQRFLYLDDFKSNNAYDGLRGNPDITAEKMLKQNYGIDLGILNSLTLSFDYYRSYTKNMLISPSGLIPEYQGISGANHAKTNTGKMKNNGVEISLNYMKAINNDLTIFAGANFSTNKNEVINVMEAANPSGDGEYFYPYNTTGYSIGQQWGYIVEGYFNSQQELDAAGLTYAFGTPRVGDFKYKDLNNDNIIDKEDRAPIGYSWFPRQYFSFSAGAEYKQFDFSFMFQGVNKISDITSGVGFLENQYEGVYSDIHRTAWTQERYDSGAKITYPALSLGLSTNHQNNSFFIMDRSYLRLKNIEIGYTLPLSASKAISSEKIRISFQAQNLFTIDNMKTKYVDPEKGSLNVFQPYRVFSIGAKLIF